MNRRSVRHGVWAALLALSVLAGCVTLDEQQRKWVFQPSKQSWWGGASAAEGMQDVWIDFHSTESGEPVRLHGLWLPQPRADAPLLLYLHGARWDVRSSAFRMRRMHELGFAVLGIDYRGFGQSTDTLPSEARAYEDARAAWDWLARQHPGPPRYVFGHSLGSAIAVQLASQVDDESGVLVEGSFTSLRDVVSSFRWGWLPVGPLITQRFDAGSRVDKLGSPLLVVHGGQDSLIQPELGRALFDRAREPKRFVLVEGGSHHNTNAVGQAQYREAVRELFGMLQ
jgi:alpha-beta hydrolase superfamily lysophospholipase